MNITDLELYRWKYHHDIYLPSIDIHALKYDWTQWWQEYGAFISTLPRQSGKTTMLGKLIRYFQERKEIFLVIVPSGFQVQNFINKVGMVNKINIRTSSSFQNLGAMSFSNTNLLIDEYHHTYDLRNILHNDWKTVTMVGTMRI